MKEVPLVIMIAIAAPAAAQTTPSSTAAPTAAPGKDPNRIICEKEDVIGTRLGAKKVCKTWLEWQQQRQEHRSSVEKVQQNTNIQKTQ